MTPAGDGPEDPAEGVRRSPNIWDHPDVYEAENRAFDPDGLVEAAMRTVHDWVGGSVLDIGCGTGFHLRRFAASAARVVGVEPHGPLREAAARRVAGLPHVEVLPGTAADLPVDAAGVDVAHARWAYFFGPGCEPGLAELDRVLAPGGTAFVIDNDATTSTFGAWFRREHPAYDPAAIERFWRRRGFTRIPVTTRWAMDTRDDLEAVVGIEFSPRLARHIRDTHPGTGVDYAVNVWWRTAG